MEKKTFGVLSLPVIVAALGYFVDIYDLLLFGIIRIKSLTSLGLNAVQVRDSGEFIISIQMAGLLIGGIIWGIMGDKKGRLSVLFGSIILYSLANIANGFVQTVDQYAWVRFVAGVGLAGELGAGITLVSESLPKEKRGIGTSLVSGLGILGAVVAFFISKFFDWRVCYFIGGGLGFLLLLLRVSVFESGMFKEIKGLKVSRGNFFMLFNNVNRLKRYLICICIGLPTWYIIGVLISFSKEFASKENLNIRGVIDPGASIMYCYVMTSIGGILIGFISQWLKSRKKALYIFYAIAAIFMILFFTQQGATASYMYFTCAGLGLGCGLWAIFVTMGAEQFGTNLRATAATTVPNMVRGSLPLIIILFKALREPFNYVTAAWITGAIIMSITIIAAIMSEETFHKDLNYLEQ
jgi:MFS family permease